jgi:hypothetical protein
MAQKNIEDVRIDCDSEVANITESFIENCKIIDGKHVLSNLYEIVATKCFISESKFSKFTAECVEVTGGSCTGGVFSEGMLLFSSVEKFDFDDCLFDTCTFDNFSFNYCRFNRCVFKNCVFELTPSDKNVMFKVCSINDSLLENCEYMGDPLDGRLCQIKGYFANLNKRLFYSCSVRKTKMVHDKVNVETNKRKGSKRQRRRYRMSYANGADYLHPNGNRGSYYSALDPYGYEDDNTQYERTKKTPGKKDTNIKRMYIFTSAEL